MAEIQALSLVSRRFTGIRDQGFSIADGNNSPRFSSFEFIRKSIVDECISAISHRSTINIVIFI